MEIKEQNENRLVLETDFVLHIFKPEYIFGAVAWAIFGMSSLFSDPESPKFLPPWWMVTIIVIVVWAIASGDVIFDCIFDKNSKTIFARTRAAWRLGIPVNKRIQFHEVQRLLLNASGRGKSTLLLQLNSKTYPFAGSATALLAEDMCDFFGVPLIIDLGSERVTRLPIRATTEDVGISATPCPKCGAPLPPIYPALQNIKCAHCGMTMFLEWNERMTSFRSRISN